MWPIGCSVSSTGSFQLRFPTWLLLKRKPKRKASMMIKRRERDSVRKRDTRHLTGSELPWTLHAVLGWPGSEECWTTKALLDRHPMSSDHLWWNFSCLWQSCWSFQHVSSQMLSGAWRNSSHSIKGWLWTRKQCVFTLQLCSSTHFS